jgi:hypothetical protein
VRKGGGGVLLVGCRDGEGRPGARKGGGGVMLVGCREKGGATTACREVEVWGRGAGERWVREEEMERRRWEEIEVADCPFASLIPCLICNARAREIASC